MAEYFFILPKWRNFAKSGRTDYIVPEASKQAIKPAKLNAQHWI